MNILDKIDALLESRILNEAIENLSSFEDIKKLCPKATSVNAELYRGIKYAFMKGKYGKENIRKDRKPKDSSNEYHTLINNGFKTVFGEYVRSEAVFCVSNIQYAFQYGDVYKIWPSDDFTVYWSSQIPDLYSLDTSKINLSSDTLKAFGVVYALIGNPRNKIGYSEFKMKTLKIDKWARDNFRKEFAECEDPGDFTAAQSSWKLLNNFANAVLIKYPNCVTDFIRAFYKKGTSTQDLLAASNSGNEVMITGSFYCLEKL